MSTHWTKEQESALNARGQDLLLSAAAGSGKTAVLTERITRLVKDPESGCQINDLLVLTFTKAAAAEMKQRISASLMAELAKADTADDLPLVHHLERQTALMGSAQISTLDSFFQSLIHQYFYLLDLDPKTRVLSDTNENYLLKEDVLTDVLETWYARADSRFLDLADLFADSYQDQRLRDTLISIYDFSRSMPFPEHWIRHLPDAYHGESGNLSSIPGSLKVLATLTEQAEQICDLYRQMFAIMTKSPAAQMVYGEQLSEEFTFFNTVAQLTDWDSLYRQPAFAFATLKSAKADQVKPFHMTTKEFNNSPEATAIKALRDAAKKAYNGKIAPFLAVPEENWTTQMAAMAPLVQVLSAVVLDFTRALSKRKQEERVMDFNDMEHYALRILLDEDNPAFTPDRAEQFPSEAALSIRGRYKEVMIDEYQDTNGIQELITTLISNGHNRFMVGDIKQSIYRFRQADPSIFLQKYNTYSGAEAAPTRRIDLNKNFRSDATLLSSINFLFRQLLTDKNLELNYSDSEALYPARREDPRPAGYVGGTVDIDLIDKSALQESDVDPSLKELEGITLEGRLIARRIHALMESGQVMNKDGTFRPITYGDIVILLRSVSGKGPLLLKVLEENHIPAVSDREEDFVRNSEVEILLALLKLLDNPLQDIPVAAVLRSWFVGLDEKDLTLLHLQGKQENQPHLFPLLKEADALLSPEKAARVAHFLAEYDHWRERSMGDGIAPLIRTILEDTDYLTFLAGLSRGTTRKNHVMAFYQLALARDSSAHNGLYTFLDYLAQLSKEDREFKTESAGKSAGAVRIMTIHRSKGLEFPVVFLADTGKSFNLSDTKRMTICHKELGLGIYYYDKSTHTAWPTLYWYALRAAGEQEARAEEARLLYVAMTRARDKLILTGVSKDVKALLTSCATALVDTAADHPEPLPSHLVTGGKSYLSWILPAAMRHRSMQNAWDLIETTPSFQSDAPTDTSDFHFTCIDERDLFTEEERALCQEKTDTTTAPAISLPKGKEKKRDVQTFLAHLPSTWPDWMDRQLTWTYDHNGATETPAKLTATAAVKLRESQEYGLADEPPYASVTLADDMKGNPEDALPADYAEPPQFLDDGKPKYTGTSYGTLMHKAMEMLDFTTLSPDAEAITVGLQKLHDEKIFTDEELATFLSRRKRSPVDDLLTFAKGPLASLMKKASTIRKEMPFSILLPADSFYPQCEPGERIFLQGVMDCLLELPDGLIIIDYKTDHTMTEQELADHYKVQLQVYGEAAEKLLGRPVLHLYLWSFTFGKAIEVEKLKRV